MALEDLTPSNGLTLQVNLNHTGEAPWHQRRDVRLTEARPRSQFAGRKPQRLGPIRPKL